jgi:hypothetical protein
VVCKTTAALAAATDLKKQRTTPGVELFTDGRQRRCEAADDEQSSPKSSTV